MEAFYAIENRLSSIFPIKRKSFLLRYPLRLAHRQASYQTSRTTIDELPERHHLHEPYIALLLALPRTDFPMKANLLLTNNPLN